VQFGEKKPDMKDARSLKKSARFLKKRTFLKRAPNLEKEPNFNKAPRFKVTGHMILLYYVIINVQNLLGFRFLG
jgi:hypothetical protein